MTGKTAAKTAVPAGAGANGNQKQTTAAKASKAKAKGKSAPREPEPDTPDKVLRDVFVAPKKKSNLNTAINKFNRRVANIGETTLRATGLVDGMILDGGPVEGFDAGDDYTYGASDDDDVPTDSRFRIMHDTLFVEDSDDDEAAGSGVGGSSGSGAQTGAANVTNHAGPGHYRHGSSGAASAHVHWGPVSGASAAVSAGSGTGTVAGGVTGNGRSRGAGSYAGAYSYDAAGRAHDYSDYAAGAGSQWAGGTNGSAQATHHHRQHTSGYPQVFHRYSGGSAVPHTMYHPDDYSSDSYRSGQYGRRTSYEDPYAGAYGYGGSSYGSSYGNSYGSSYGNSTGAPYRSTSYGYEGGGDIYGGYYGSRQTRPRPRPRQRHSSEGRSRRSARQPADEGPAYDSTEFQRDYYSYFDDTQRAAQLKKEREEREARKGKFWQDFIDPEGDQDDEYVPPRPDSPESVAAGEGGQFFTPSATPPPAGSSPPKVLRKVGGMFAENPEPSKYSAKALFGKLRNKNRVGPPVVSGVEPATKAASKPTDIADKVDALSVKSAASPIAPRTVTPGSPRPASAMSAASTGSSGSRRSQGRAGSPLKNRVSLSTLSATSDSDDDTNGEPDVSGQPSSYWDRIEETRNWAAEKYRDLSAATLLGSTVGSATTAAAALSSWWSGGANQVTDSGAADHEEPMSDAASVRSVRTARSMAPSVAPSARSVAASSSARSARSVRSVAPSVHSTHSTHSTAPSTAPSTSATSSGAAVAVAQTSPKKNRFKRTMKFIFEKPIFEPPPPKSKARPPSIHPSVHSDAASIRSVRTSASKTPDGSVPDSDDAATESEPQQSDDGQGHDGTLVGKMGYFMAPVASSFVRTFREFAHFSVVLRPLDAIADTFPSLQSIVVVMELIFLIWILYQVSIIVEAIATAVRAFCMPVIVVCRLMGAKV